MGNNSSPRPDPQMGEAAKMSAETGQQMLEFMKSQASITNEWAADDRARDINTFRPLQDQFIKDAQTWASPGRKAAKASEAASQVSLASRLAQGQTDRQMMAMGVNPASGAALASRRRASTDTALARAGAINLSNRQIEAEAEAKKANAINMGSGLAVNPGTSMGLSNGAGQAGFSGAMQGYGQQASILNQDYQARMQSWQQDQAGSAGLLGAIGSIAGAYGPSLLALSSKDAKTDKRPIPDGEALGAIRKMPVERWRYKEGMGDEGEHVGPYAQDFQAATGKGDGQTIPLMEAISVTMKAVQDLDKKIDGKLKKAA
ncbi:tail fiber domain-containing protein [Paracoccus sp. 22332]|uniref:tail fiber domain-containing protein n=1 Tax=Paracoccus sp. 22332 TaxID=3453913 RepID=UPI003F82894A